MRACTNEHSQPCPHARCRPLAGSYAINPASGERVPIWVADYVLGSYGSGAIMAVRSLPQSLVKFTPLCCSLAFAKAMGWGANSRWQLPAAAAGASKTLTHSIPNPGAWPRLARL